MRTPWLALLIMPALSVAQTPDVRIRTDLRLHYRSQTGGDSSLRWYDPLGRHSLVSIEFGLEPGFRAFISERLQKIPGNADNEQLDEYYVEDPGLWRVGKQFLPFGKQKILREAAKGARGDTNLVFEDLPVSIAICDNGSGRARGVIGRVGGRIGFSAAVGNNFAAQSTSLVQVRHPEDGNGFGRGYRLAVGADFSKRIGSVAIEAEIVGLRNGQTSADFDTEISDLSATYARSKDWSFSLGWAREWRRSDDFFRAEGRVQILRNLYLEPLVRFKGSELFDAGISVRVKM